MLEKFLGQYPNAASADLALLTLGELRLRQYEAGAGTNQPALAITNAPAATNILQLALASFDTLVKKFPQSPLFGKAQLDLGWCYWREGRLSEAQAAFQAAVERLPTSRDQATAYFRLADTQFQQTNYAGGDQELPGDHREVCRLAGSEDEPVRARTLRDCARRARGG